MDLLIPQSEDYDYTSNITSLSDPLGDYISVRNMSITISNLSSNSDNSNICEKSNDLSDSINKCITKKTDFEKMLYFVCNLCPYMCIKGSKISEHLKIVHNNKARLKPPELKCPACPNIFFRYMSLKAHLIYDHKVSTSDLRHIIQAVMYYAKKTSNGAVKVQENKSEIPTCDNNSKTEINMNLIKKLTNNDVVMNNEKLINNEHSYSKEPTLINESNVGKIRVKDLQQERYVEDDGIKETPVKGLRLITLPMVDVTQSDLKKTFGTLIKQKQTLSPFSKFLDQKRTHRCTVAQCKVYMQKLENLEYHIKSHMDTTFKCPECDEVYTFWKPLSAHLWRIHKIDMELYACDKCNYKTNSLGKLNNCHRLIHGDIRAFECETCQKKFKNTKQLRNHKIIHRDKIKKYTHICDVCKKSFSDRRQLKVHMDVVHKKIKPFLCSYCGYRGASKSSLRMHIRQHTGEKPFSCDSCEYSTADHNSLRRHKLRHSGQKPYKCSHCDYACIQTSTYKEHIRTKHPGMEKDFVFTCQACQFRTVNQVMYMSHLVLIHQQKKTE